MKKPNYTKLAKNIQNEIFSDELLYVTLNDQVWIYHTCHRALKQGKIPGQAKTNNLKIKLYLMNYLVLVQWRSC